MPCVPINPTPERLARVRTALQRLESALAAGTVQAVIGAQGALAFKGWQDNDGVSDLCAYRRLLASNSPALRKALARAEAMAGRKVDQGAIAQGTHSHDGGMSWSNH